MGYVKDQIKNILVNSFGWHTNRKIIVFESDDWGSIRMASKDAYNSFLNKGFKVNQCPFNSNDMLESNTDVEYLLTVLSSFKDSNAKSPIFTINNVVANPDFEKIRDSNFQKYFHEPFTETLKRYKNHHNVYNLLKEGESQNLFKMQFHGREHVNIHNWLGHLKAPNATALEAFNQNMFTVHKSGGLFARNEFLDTYGLGYKNGIMNFSESISDGLSLFRDLWGHNSASFIAPTYVWNSSVEESASKLGVKYLQGLHIQRVPNSSKKNRFSKKYHYLGQKNKIGQTYLVRNAIFEPTSNPKMDWVNACFKEINIAFKMNKPALISTHRVNYIGGINEKNRTQNLSLLEELIGKILKKHPDVEFMASDQLGDLISNSNN